MSQSLQNVALVNVFTGALFPVDKYLGGGLEDLQLVVGGQGGVHGAHHQGRVVCNGHILKVRLQVYLPQFTAILRKLIQSTGDDLLACKY